MRKKDLGFIHEKGKSHSEGSGPEPSSKEEGHDDKQTRGTVAEPCLQQNQNSNSETGPRTDPAPNSSESQTIEDRVAMNSPIPRAWKSHRSHPLDQILTDLNSRAQTRSKLKNFCAFFAFLSNIEPKNVYEVVADLDWITTMQEELHQFERNKVWHLVPMPKDRTIIGTK